MRRFWKGKDIERENEIFKPTHFVSVAGLVTNENKEILLIKSPWRGWEYPGGIVESGETLQEALIREIKEESGVDVKITGIIGLSKNIGRDIVSIDFLCKFIKGELTTSNESLEVKWIEEQKALDMVTFSSTKKRLENMLSEKDTFNCFNFKQNPFKVIEEQDYSVGKR